jgi:hypothetical protein
MKKKTPWRATPADLRKLKAIGTTTDPAIGAALIHAYWRDTARAERTPRSTLYLHLGMLTGYIARLTEADRLPRKR